MYKQFKSLVKPLLLEFIYLSIFGLALVYFFLNQQWQGTTVTCDQIWSTHHCCLSCHQKIIIEGNHLSLLQFSSKGQKLDTAVASFSNWQLTSNVVEKIIHDDDSKKCNMLNAHLFTTIQLQLCFKCFWSYSKRWILNASSGALALF